MSAWESVPAISPEKPRTWACTSCTQGYSMRRASGPASAMTPAARTVSGVTRMPRTSGHHVIHPGDDFFFFRLLVVVDGLMSLSIPVVLVERCGMARKTAARCTRTCKLLSYGRLPLETESETVRSLKYICFMP